MFRNCAAVEIRLLMGNVVTWVHHLTAQNKTSPNAAWAAVGMLLLWQLWGSKSGCL
jgi:hypothetical protein